MRSRYSLEVEYLGHVFTRGRNKPPPSIVKIIVDFKQPTSVKQLLGFLDLTGYFRKFIKDYSNLYGKEIVVRTDNRPLQWLKNLENPATRLARFLIIARHFAFRIEFISGKQNKVSIFIYIKQNLKRTIYINI